MCTRDSFDHVIAPNSWAILSYSSHPDENEFEQRQLKSFGKAADACVFVVFWGALITHVLDSSQRSKLWGWGIIRKRRKKQVSWEEKTTAKD